MKGGWGVVRSMGICCWNRVCGSAGYVEVGVGMWVGYGLSCGSGVYLILSVLVEGGGECVEVSMAEGGSTCGVV